jgi:fatty-acyl-CoA synthase
MMTPNVAVPEMVEASPAKAWLRSLQWTASIPRNRTRTLPVVVQELGDKYGARPALLSDRESMTYRELADRVGQYARWALAEGIAPGDVVGLLMPNRPEYLAIWLGIASVGGVVALLNTNLPGPALSHCMQMVAPKHIIVAEELSGSLESVLAADPCPAQLWVHGAERTGFRCIDAELECYPGGKLSAAEQLPIAVQDRALLIFTSGTTGMPKAACVSHARVLQWTHWFAGMMDVMPDDRMYDCLPMYHSVGGVLAPGAMLVGGGSIVIREKFSASRFWNDVVRWDCTIFQYIGELCRYLVQAAPSRHSSKHRIRLACGNGLAPDVWDRFQQMFHIPRILEFYASTEGAISLFNVEGRRGAIGRVPPYLVHRFSPALVRFDTDKGQPVRDGRGFCIPCAVNEPGEALGRVADDDAHIGTRFDGYTDARASGDKILRNVFSEGDAWVRTGDLLRKDEQGFFYFVDRVGETFRWKGENVSTSEVTEAIRDFPGVQHTAVYGVKVECAEGKAGMAMLVAPGKFDLAAFRRYLAGRLPFYARPVFLRFSETMAVTGTWKYPVAQLAREGFNPRSTSDRIYVDSPKADAYIPLGEALYERIQAGEEWL